MDYEKYIEFLKICIKERSYKDVIEFIKNKNAELLNRGVKIVDVLTYKRDILSRLNRDSDPEIIENTLKTIIKRDKEFKI